MFLTYPFLSPGRSSREPLAVPDVNFHILLTPDSYKIDQPLPRRRTLVEWDLLCSFVDSRQQTAQRRLLADSLLLGHFLPTLCELQVRRSWHTTFLAGPVCGRCMKVLGRGAWQASTTCGDRVALEAVKLCEAHGMLLVVQRIVHHCTALHADADAVQVQMHAYWYGNIARRSVC
jgi:hypothetical protein